MFKKILKFLQLSERGGNLSLTNVAMYVVLTKVAISPFDWTGAAVLLPVFASYMQKRYESNKFEVKAQEATKLAAVEAAKPVVSLAELEEIKANYAELKAQHEQVSKIADKAKEFMSSQSVARGFQAPVRKPGQN